MRLKQYTKWQLGVGLRQLAACLVIALAVWAALIAFVGIFSSTGSSVGMMSGMGDTVFVFLFVVGIVYFSMGLRTGLANSVSRKSIFWGQAVTIVAISAVAAVACTAIDLGFDLVLGNSWAHTASTQFTNAPTGAVAAYLGNVVYNFGGGVLSMATGAFIGGAYYRMNKTLKIIVSIGVPALLIFGMPLLFSFVEPRPVGWFVKMMAWILEFGNRTVYTATLVQILIAIVLIVLVWLLMRRAPAKAPAK